MNKWADLIEDCKYEL